MFNQLSILPTKKFAALICVPFATLYFKSVEVVLLISKCPGAPLFKSFPKIVCDAVDVPVGLTQKSKLNELVDEFNVLLPVHHVH